MSRRFRYDPTSGEVVEVGKVKESDVFEGTRSVISDALGVTVNQIDEFRRDLEVNKISGVEFKQDPHEPTFYQVHARSQHEMNMYMKHRGFINKGRFPRDFMSQEELDRAITQAKEKWPVKEAEREQKG